MSRRKTIIQLKELPLRSRILSENEIDALYGGDCKPSSSGCFNTEEVVSYRPKTGSDGNRWLPNNANNACCSCKSHLWQLTDTMAYYMCD